MSLELAKEIINANLVRFSITDEENLLEVTIHQEAMGEDGDGPNRWWVDIGTADQSNAAVFKGVVYHTDYLFEGPEGGFGTKIEALKAAFEFLNGLVR